MSFHGIPENDVITRDKFVIRRFIRNGMQGQSGFFSGAVRPVKCTFQEINNNENVR